MISKCVDAFVFYAKITLYLSVEGEEMFGYGDHGRAQLPGFSSGSGRLYDPVRGVGSALVAAARGCDVFIEQGRQNRCETNGTSGFYPLDMVALSYAQLNYFPPEQIRVLISTLPDVSYDEYRQSMEEWRQWCQADIDTYFRAFMPEWIPLERGGWEQYVDLPALRDTYHG